MGLSCCKKGMPKMIVGIAAWHVCHNRSLVSTTVLAAGPLIRSSRGCATRLHSRSVPSARVTANCEVEQTPRVDSSAGCSRLADAPLYTSRPTDWPWMLPRSEIVGAIDSRCCYFSSDISLASGVPPKASPGSLSRLVVGRPPSKHGLAATLLTSSLVVWLKSRLGTLTRPPSGQCKPEARVDLRSGPQPSSLAFCRSYLSCELRAPSWRARRIRFCVARHPLLKLLSSAVCDGLLYKLSCPLSAVVHA